MISIIIPTYNSSNYLRDSLSSVLNQTFKDWEIIVVDGGSRDNTQSVVEDFMKYNNLAGRLKYYRYENHIGVSEARNAGIKASSREFISFLDSDDIWYPNKLERVINIFLKFPRVDLVCHDELLSINGEIIDKLKYSEKLKNLSDKATVYENLFLENFLSTSAVTVKRYCLKDNLFDTTLLVAEDYDLWLRLSYKYQFYFLDEFLGEYRKIENEALSNNIRRMCAGEIQVLKKNRNRKLFGSSRFYKRVFLVYLRAIRQFF